MSKAIGIDLGTTNSVVAIKKINTDIILNSEGEQLTPSVVSMQVLPIYKKNVILVGKPALDWMLQDPGNTITSIKRLMGRGYSDPEIQALLAVKRFAYHLKAIENASENSLCVTLNQQEYTPEQISAIILEKLKKDSEQKQNESIEYAVVTVPAYFNDKQKMATRRAVALAGLKVQRLLPEPTAAAISFGVDNLKNEEAKTVLIYDLGGGTFDISILTIAEGQFIEQGKAGDMWMGGDDIDNLIQKHVYAEVEKEYEIESLLPLIEKLKPADKNYFKGEIKRKIEQAKIKLSSSEKAHIDILGLLKDEDGDIIDIDITLQRTKFEELLSPFVERTISLSKKLIADIGFEIDLIEQVILVGGSSSIPLIIKEIKQLFGKDKVLLHPRPMLAIAEGAAILAHRLSDYYECPQCGSQVSQNDKICASCQFDLEENMSKSGLLDIVHSSSHDYFIELEGGNMHKLAEQNTPLPFNTEASFRLMDNKQKLAHLKFYNGVNEKQESIGSLWLRFDLDDDEEQNDLAEIHLDFEVDINNIITVSAVIKEMPDTHISKTLSRGGVDEQLFIELEKSIDEVNKANKGYYVNYEFLHRSMELAEQINCLIDLKTGKVDNNIHMNIIKMQQTAKDIFAHDESFYGNINYAESFFDDCSHLMNDKERAQFEKLLNIFINKVKTAARKDILPARKNLLSEIDKYPFFGVLQSISQAAELVMKIDNNKFHYFMKAISEIKAAMASDNEEDIIRCVDEVLPEAMKVIKSFENEELHIFKDIQKKI